MNLLDNYSKNPKFNLKKSIYYTDTVVSLSRN